jgi:hypothetical protein
MSWVLAALRLSAVVIATEEPEAGMTEDVRF